ncbi:nucleoside transporter C-terminal domain-containing protein [Pontibacter sp. G13]|uniref:NupC/NupG family nucleoside CNT transporter n=1 Tax=Pontibacter sp. G13 TaxID=3074898 RepID=UPI00288A6949|nr:nucleoside transporter C-terminal domain-containing protein [Pontibacter sp. G13]WNJ20345.1 nucleoside transporter C-terminal domain-containing protein [Pontibacter sp. G13]
MGSTSWGQSISPDTLILDWTIHSSSAIGTDSLQAGDKLSLQKDFHFALTQTRDRAKRLADGTVEYVPKTETHKGYWALDSTGTQLILFHERLPMEYDIDSVSYQVDDKGNAQLKLFHQQKAVALQYDDRFESARRRTVYDVELDPYGNPSLFQPGVQIHLAGRDVLIQDAFSFWDFLRGLLGLGLMLGLGWVFSTNRKAIDWRLILAALAMQVILAVSVLQIDIVNQLFTWMGGIFKSLLEFTKDGSDFLFAGLVSDTSTFGYIFAFQVLPTVVFFSAVTALLYYLGILQKIVFGFAMAMRFFFKLFGSKGLSGAESLAAAGNIFLGQTEAPLLIRPYLDKMTRSEIMSLMTGGMATIAGGVFAAYIGYLGGEDPEQQQLFATHLLTASIMSAPAALLMAKLLVPETDEVNTDLTIPKEKVGSNILDAISIGTTDGLKLAVNVGVMLLVFTALIAMVNALLGWMGDFTGLNQVVVDSTGGRYDQFNLQYLLGLVCSPIAWLLGVHPDDTMAIGQLLGEKTILNEFFAYTSLGTMKSTGGIVHEKSLLIATYALCGFANFASIGIQIGGIGALASGQRKNLSELGIRALLGGTLAAFMTAAIAGMMYGM